MHTICRNRLCEFYAECPLRLRLGTTCHSYPDQYGTPTYFALCELTGYFVDELPADQVVGYSMRDGEIHPGEACKHFVTYCNEREHLIKMKILQKTGEEAEYSFTVLSDLAWKVIRQLVEADSYPIVIANPRPNGANLDLRNMFHGTKGLSDNREQFYRYIHTERIGMKAAYSLKQVQRKMR